MAWCQTTSADAPGGRSLRFDDRPRIALYDDHFSFLERDKSHVVLQRKGQDVLVGTLEIGVVEMCECDQRKEIEPVKRVQVRRRLDIVREFYGLDIWSQNASSNWSADRPARSIGVTFRPLSLIASISSTIQCGSSSRFPAVTM